MAVKTCNSTRTALTRSKAPALFLYGSPIPGSRFCAIVKFCGICGPTIVIMGLQWFSNRRSSDHGLQTRGQTFDYTG